VSLRFSKAASSAFKFQSTANRCEANKITKVVTFVSFLFLEFLKNNFIEEQLLSTVYW
jgi:hypothetical protein